MTRKKGAIWQMKAPPTKISHVSPGFMSLISKNNNGNSQLLFLAIVSHYRRHKNIQLENGKCVTNQKVVLKGHYQMLFTDYFIFITLSIVCNLRLSACSFLFVKHWLFFSLILQRTGFLKEVAKYHWFFLKSVGVGDAKHLAEKSRTLQD